LLSTNIISFIFKKMRTHRRNIAPVFMLVQIKIIPIVYSFEIKIFKVNSLNFEEK